MPQPEPKRLVGRAELAQLMGVTPRRITLWASDGMPVAEGGGRGKEGRYDLAAVIAWRAQRKARDHASGSLAQERAKLADAQRRKTELGLRRLEGQLLERAEVKRVWARHVLDVARRFDALPRAQAERLVAVASAEGASGVERVLREEINRVLQALGGEKPK